jgi:hypothetical protein
VRERERNDTNSYGAADELSSKKESSILERLNQATTLL